MTDRLEAKLPKTPAEILGTPLSALDLPKLIRAKLEAENVFRPKLHFEPIVTVKDWLTETPCYISKRGSDKVKARIDAECEKLGVTPEMRKAYPNRIAAQEEAWKMSVERWRAFDDWCHKHRKLIDKLRDNPEVVERLRKELQSKAAQ